MLIHSTCIVSVNFLLSKNICANFRGSVYCLYWMARDSNIYWMALALEILLLLNHFGPVCYGLGHVILFFVGLSS
uniref:Uncharacterized protein n=1 Tax=Arundo donax TaxID=35708 RepID=A0A0A9BCG5_ARUDO